MKTKGHTFKVGDILGINPVPCSENTMARNNLKYLYEHFNGKVTENTRFVVVSIDPKDKSMIDVAIAGKESGRVETTYASRFVLYKSKPMFDEGLFEL